MLRCNIHFNQLPIWMLRRNIHFRFQAAPRRCGCYVVTSISNQLPRRFGGYVVTFIQSTSPTVDHKCSLLSSLEPGPLNTGNCYLTPVTNVPKFPPKQCPQAPPKCPQVPPKCPQVPPKCPVSPGQTLKG